MKSPLLVFAAIAITATLVSPASLKHGRNAPSVRADGGEFRLPNNSVPLRYNIKLIPCFGDLEDSVFTFAGEVGIDIVVIEQTATITLHAEQLEINRTIVTSTNSVPVLTNTNYNQDLHFYTLTFATPLTPGNYLIHIEYTGQLRDDFTGFYRNNYNTSSGEIRWYAGSFFTPVYARRAFPCFDEPALKARFNISIAHWPNQVAISNALFENQSEPDSTIGNRVWSRFSMTPLMSTYLVAFLVSDFEYVSNDADSFRTWSRPEALSTASHSLASVQLLNQLSTYTAMNYESFIPKMDQVALPTSATIAMENWGLITFREPWILWKDGDSTTRNKQDIETSAAHEFAHQWFGNLVSPEWWKYVWLSEGFSSYFEYYTAAQVNPSWRLMEQFTVDICQKALLADSLDTSRSLNQDVYSPDEVKSAFDVISYNKGACILRMMSHFLGEAIFQTGLQIYLTNNSYGTGNPDELWDALTEANNISSNSPLLPHVYIKPVMDTWTNQKGYPVITVTRNYTSSTQVISQERFSLEGPGSSSDTADYKWWIPINFVSQSTPNFSDAGNRNWIRPQDESVIMSRFEASEWVIYNVQQTGFYRVNYDDQNWNMIAEYLRSSEFTNIPPVNRAQLIDDAFNLARAGYLNYSIAFSLSQYLTQETDHVPWVAAFNVFAYLQRMLAHSSSYVNLQRYLFSRVVRIHGSLGYEAQENDAHMTSFLRANSHTWACRMGCPSCFAQSHQFVQNFYNSDGNSPIPADLRGFAYCEGLRNASIDVWNFMWNRYLATDVAGEQNLIITGLGCSLDRNILSRYEMGTADCGHFFAWYLSFSIDENSGVRSHHRRAIFDSVSSGSPFNVDVALDFLLTNINNVSVSYGGSGVVQSLLQNLAEHLVSERHLVFLRAFISEQNDPLDPVVSAAQHAVEIAEKNIAWLGIYEGDIMRWISPTDAGNSLVAFSPIILLIVSAILNYSG